MPRSALDRQATLNLHDGEPRPTGSSSVAEAFGADVGMTGDGVLLCLVVGRAGSPQRAVSSVGGTVLVRIPDGCRVLATAPYSALVALQRHPDVALAGPVSIDLERFGRFAQLAGLDSPAGGQEVQTPDPAA